MKIFELLRNPLVKTAGVAAIIYFGLFANKESPNSLGNRFSSQNVKKNFSEMQEKGRFIASNLRIAKTIQAEKNSQVQLPEIVIEDLQIGNSEELLSCGDEAEISYGIYDYSGKQIKFIEKEKLIIGSKNNEIFEENIVGMKQDGIRNINLEKNTKINDKKLDELAKINNSNLKIQVTLLSFKKNSTSKINCN